MHPFWLVGSCAELDILLVSHQVMALVSSDPVPSIVVLVLNVAMDVPQLSDGVLYNDSFIELEWAARELGTFFFDLFGIGEPFLHVVGYLRV